MGPNYNLATPQEAATQNMIDRMAATLSESFEAALSNVEQRASREFEGINERLNTLPAYTHATTPRIAPPTASKPAAEAAPPTTSSSKRKEASKKHCHFF